MKQDTARLVERMKQGDPASFQDILDWYADDVLRLCYLLLWDADEAKDMLQETMMRFIQRIKTKPFHAHNGSVKAYLLTCARNLCIDRLRRRKHFVFSIDDVGEEEWNPIDSVSPSDVLADKQVEESFQTALDELTDLERAVVVLFEVEGVSHSEIVNQLGIGLSHSKTLLHRARYKLRTRLQQYIDRG